MSVQMDNDGQRGTPWRAAVWSGAGLLFAAPVIASQFSGAMSWTAFDFALWGALLASAAGAFELAARMGTGPAHRTAAALAVGAAFCLIWINLAVGMMGSESEPANLIYAGVLLVGLIGAALARLRPAGMARAMVATAVAQGLTAIYALSVGEFEAAAFSVVLIAAWLTSAALFRKPGRNGTAAG